jgi:hypothetical protein
VIHTIITTVAWVIFGMALMLTLVVLTLVWAFVHKAVPAAQLYLLQRKAEAEEEAAVIRLEQYRQAQGKDSAAPH